MSDLELTPFRLLIDRVPEEARRHFRQMFLPIALPLTLVGLALIAFQLQWAEDFLGAVAGETAAGETSTGDPAQLAGPADILGAGLTCGTFVLAVIAFFAVYTLGFCALMVGSVQAVYGQRVDMWRAWLFPLQPRVLATMAVVAALSFVSLAMFLLPALWVIPVLTFVLPVMIVEDRYGFEAIRRSVRMAHFNPGGRWTGSVWLQTLVLLFIGAVVYYAVSFTAQLPFVIVQQVLIFRDAATGGPEDPAGWIAGMLWLQIPTQIATAFATAAAWMYSTFGVAMLYREVRRRRDGEDLRQAIEALTGPGHAP